jgi:hypothetical protein
MAVKDEGSGIPGVSGELKAQGVPTRPRWAKLPGVVPCDAEVGLLPKGGNVQGLDLPKDVETEKSSDMRVSKPCDLQLFERPSGTTQGGLKRL